MGLIQFLIPIVAALIGAFIGAALAFFYQNRMEIKKEKRAILQALMMHRGVGAGELDWIKALNAIDLVYHDEQDVVELYHKFVSLTNPEVYQSQQYYEAFVDMVYTMAQHTGYTHLTKTNIRQVYTPEALAQHYPGRFLLPAPANASSVVSIPSSAPTKELNPGRN